MLKSIRNRLAAPQNRITLAIGTGAVALILIALFLYGGLHGMYADDYVYRFFGSGIARTVFTPPNMLGFRVLAIWLASRLAVYLPDFELLLRVGLVSVHGLNVVLLGALATRLTGSRWCGVMAGLLFLIPLFGYEPLLWFSAGIFYLFPLCLLLIGLHLTLRCRDIRKQFYLPLLTVLAWGAMLLFIEAGLFLPLLLPGMVLLLRRRGVTVDWRAWVGVLILFYAAAGVLTFLALQNSPVIAVHGQTELDPLAILTQRLPETANSALDYVREWLPRGIFADALQLGAMEWQAQGWIWLLGAVAVGAVGVLWRDLPRAWQNETASNPLGLLGLGLAWFALALAPVLLIRGLDISSRVMLFPSAGSALAAAGALGWSLEVAPKKWVLRAGLVLAALFVFINALAMAGLLRVYELRNERDQLQLNGLYTALPHAPDTRVWVMAHALDQSILPTQLGHKTQLDQLLFALFDIPWAAEPALRVQYETEQIQVIDKDMLRQIQISGVDVNAKGKATALEFHGVTITEKVPVANLIAFTYRANGFAWLDPLIITRSDAPPQEIRLPLIEPLDTAPHREARLGLEE